MGDTTTTTSKPARDGLTASQMEPDPVSPSPLTPPDSAAGTATSNTCLNGTQSTRHSTQCPRTASKTRLSPALVLAHGATATTQAMDDKKCANTPPVFASSKREEPLATSLWSARDANKQLLATIRNIKISTSKQVDNAGQAAEATCNTRLPDDHMMSAPINGSTTLSRVVSTPTPTASKTTSTLQPLSVPTLTPRTQ